jgi:hypothetical protein
VSRAYDSRPYRSFIQAGDIERQNHLGFVFANIEIEQVARGELERLRAVEREARALKLAVVGPWAEQPDNDPARVFVQGSALAALFELL